MKRYELKIIVGGGYLYDDVQECDDLMVDDAKYKFIKYNNPGGIGSVTVIAIYPVDRTIISKIKKLD